MKKNLLVFLLALAGLAAKSQTYTVAPIAFNPVSFDSGIQVVSPVDDLWGQVLGIGFDFYFFGIPYQTLVVGTNGQLSFNTTVAETFENWSITGPIPQHILNDTKNTIMFPWHDLDCTNKGKVRHHVYGTPPNRIFVVSFDSMPYFGSPNSVTTGYCTPDEFTGQVILYEGSSAIDINILNKDTCTRWNSGYAIEGIIDSAGTQTFTVPGRNATVWTASHDAWRFSPDSAWQGPHTTTVNRISGRVFADQNADCAFNGTDYALRNKPVIFTNDVSQQQDYIFTDLQGYYSKLVDTGHYSFTTANLANNLYASNCPVTGSYHAYFPAYGDSSVNNLFADTAIQSCTSLIASLWVGNTNNLLNAVNACDTATIIIRCTNQGTITDTASLVLTLNDSTQILTASSTYTRAGNICTFNAAVLGPDSTVSITLSVKIGCDTAGTEYCYSLAAHSAYNAQCNGSSNLDNICGFLGRPFDPNSLYVSSLDNPEAGFVQRLQATNHDALSYLVTFQNTGSGTAHNVEVRVPLSSRIDTNTLALTASSFAGYQWLVLNNTLIADFNGINLPYASADSAGSEGFFKFTVKQLAGNVAGDSIVHTAAIYFDNNPAVNTNRAVVAIPETTGITALNMQGITLYPNPAQTSVQLITNQPGQVKITDATGRIILTQQLTLLNTRLDISTWAQGVYLIVVHSDNYNSVLKFIKN